MRAADCLAAGATAKVLGVTDGMTIALGDGRSIRLAAIGVPTAPVSGRPNAYADMSRDALDRLLRGRTMTLRGRIDQDRYGRYVAEAARDDGLWLQGEMLRLGQAWVATTPEQRDLAPAMLAIEGAARADRRGLWRARAYAIKTVATFDHTSDSFEILEGQVAGIAESSGVSTISFAEGSLTLKADRAAARRFSDAGMPLSTLAGEPIRVRGWPYWGGHPTLNLTHPEQIERLQATAPPEFRIGCRS